MMRFQGSSLVCPVDQRCSQWARVYLKYCLCSVKDSVSLTLGLVSVASWGVAEVPQIITNYKEKSTEGLSIAFLMTWIVGDLFNLAGCLLEPATLPTQFYMALLYTATTVVLTAQTIYYGHIYPRLKENKVGQPHKGHKFNLDEKITEEKPHEGFIVEKQFNARDDPANGSNITNEVVHLTSSPIPVAASAFPHNGSFGRDLYYMSARSLSRSPNPTVGLFLVHSRDLGRTPPVPVHDQRSIVEPLLLSAQSAPPLNTKSMLCVVASAVLFLGSVGLHLPIDSRLTDPPPGLVILVGRKILQDNDGVSSLKNGGGSSGIGTILGWSMAAIYMGGRLPQICLNIRRGNVDGLNSLMFVFALVGNATYVASILVNSLDWSRIKPNLPWLVDAGGCVLLDAFILIQFIYYRYWKAKDFESRRKH